MYIFLRFNTLIFLQRRFLIAFESLKHYFLLFYFRDYDLKNVYNAWIVISHGHFSIHSYIYDKMNLWISILCQSWLLANCENIFSPKRLSMLIVINFSLKSRTRTHVFTLLSPWKTLFQFYIDFVRGFHCIVVSVSIVIIIVLQNVCVVVRMSNILHGTFEMPFLWRRWYTTSVVVPVRNITNIELLSCRSCEEYYYM